MEIIFVLILWISPSEQQSKKIGFDTLLIEPLWIPSCTFKLKSNYCPRQLTDLGILNFEDRIFVAVFFSSGKIKTNIQNSTCPNWWQDFYGHLLLISSGNLPNGQCFTTNDSPDKNAQCKLPFKFDGVLRQGCITDTDPDDRYWCSTKVDENLDHIPGNGYWGYCDQSCPPLISTETKQLISIETKQGKYAETFTVSVSV